MKKVILDNLPENFMQIFCSQNIGEDRLEEYIGVISSYMSLFKQKNFVIITMHLW